MNNNSDYFQSNDLGFEDYKVGFRQPGFYLDPTVGPVDINTIPSNGTEFVLMSKLVEESVQLPPVERTEKKKPNSLQRWAAAESSSFASLSHELNKDRAVLVKKFPLNVVLPPVSEEEEWCKFVLGSEICSELFGGYGNNESNVNKKGKQGHPPYLSITLHLNQEEIMELLTYFKKWFCSIGMADNLGRWIYAVLACLQKPLKTEYEKFLEEFYDSCKKYMKSCEGEEKDRIYLISYLLSYHFCVKAYKIGPSLERCIELRKKNR
ncbi:Gem-associated protein 2, partial [Stegodyphus mimosarum]